MKMISRGIIVSALLLTSVLAFQNCSNVRLTKADSSVSAESQGYVCTRSPANLDYLQRTIFILDMSESMAGIDPAPMARRVQGLRKLINDFRARNDDNFTIAVGAVFASTVGYLPSPGGGTPSMQGNCTFLKPRVDDDYAKLNIALDQLDLMSANATGNTPYASFFSTVNNCLQADIGNNPSAAYNVVFVTDGAPTDITPTDVYAKTREMIVNGKANAADPNQASRVNFFMHFMNNINNSADEALLANNMITTAQSAGAYRSAYTVDQGGPIDYQTTIGFLNMRRMLKQIFITNMNMATSLRDGTLKVDSDGDGLTDEDEIRLGYDPVKYNSKGDCSDLIHYRYGRCPTSCAPTQVYADSDHDGLTDCDELNLGTNRYNVDTDNDGIPDGLEVRIGSNPRDPEDVGADVDNDGAKTMDEARRQTSVFMDDRAIAHRSLASVSIRQVDDMGGERCYEITMKHMPIFATRAVVTDTLSDLKHNANENVIKILFFQVPEDVPGAKATLLHGVKILSTDGGDQVIDQYNDFTGSDLNLYNPDSL
jgi:hypothetical protein